MSAWEAMAATEAEGSSLAGHVTGELSSAWCESCKGSNAAGVFGGVAVRLCLRGWFCSVLGLCRLRGGLESKLCDGELEVSGPLGQRH